MQAGYKAFWFTVGLAVLLPVGEASTAQGAITFSVEKTIILPDSLSNPSIVLFGDADGDSIADIALMNGTHIAVYSPQFDFVMFVDRRTKDGALATKIVFADFSEDGLADLAILYEGHDTLLFQPYFVVEYRTAHEGYSIVHKLRYIGEPWFQFNGFSAVDLTNDSQPELLLSASGVKSFMFDERSAGFYEIWDVADSVNLASDSVIINHIERIALNEKSPRYAGRVSEWYGSSLGSPNIVSTHTGVVIFDSLGAYSQLMSGPFPPLYSCNESQDIFRYQLILTSGNIFANNDNISYVLSMSGWQVSCTNDHITWTSDSLREWHLNRIFEDASMDIAWSMSANDRRSYDHFAVLDELHGYFVAFDNVDLVIFRGSDGSEVNRGTVSIEGSYYWDKPYGDERVRLVAINGRNVNIHVFDVATDIKENQEAAFLPSRFTLSMPYPNPFNPDVSFEIAIPSKGNLIVSVFNVQGQQVASLYSGEVAVGISRLLWNAEEHSSGVYFVSAQFEGETRAVKALLLK